MGAGQDEAGEAPQSLVPGLRLSSEKRTGRFHFMILRYLFTSLFSRPVPPTQVVYFLPVLGEPPVKREMTTNNVKS